jgi:hypothetical protein
VYVNVCFVGSVFDAMSRQAFRDNTCVWIRTVIPTQVTERMLTNGCPVRVVLTLRSWLKLYLLTAVLLCCSAVVIAVLFRP